MLMNINYHYANGTAAKHTIDTFGNKTTVIDAPKQAAWIEFVDAKNGISPQKIITKRQGNDLLVFFEQGESEPDLIIKDYYANDELPPILGLDSQGAYHAYVAELAQPELALDKLASGVTSAQVLSSEAYNMAAFPWWHVGGIAAGLGLVGLVAGGGGSGGGNPTNPDIPAPFENKPQGDGSVSFDLPDIPNDITRVEITYTPTGSTTPVVAVIEKDPATGKYISRDPNVKVDPESGKVTIAEEHIQDGTDVSVVVTNDKGMSSDPATTTAGKDYADDTQLEQPVIKALTDKSDRADNNPEELIVEGKTEPLAEVTIKDKNGNVVGKGTADENGDYRIPVVERDKGDNDINSGDKLTVIAKADGKNPTETKVTVPNAEDNGVTIKHTGDSVGPENPPVINKDPNTGETQIQFPDDNGDTKEVEIDYTPKGGDSTTPDHINVEKDKDGNVDVEYKPGDNEFPINIDRTSNPDGGSETGVTFTPENQDKPIKIEVEKDKDGNTTTNVELTPDGKDKPINIEVKKDENGNIVVEIKDQDGKVIGGEDQLPDNVKVDGNGTVKIDTDGNKDTPADTVINSDGSISVPPGVTVKPDGNVEIDTDKNPGTKPTKPIVIDPEGNVTIPDGATEPGTNIDATGKDLAGNPSDTNGVESTEPANPNPNGGTPLPPKLTANEDGSVTVTLPTADKDGTPVKDDDKVVLTFDKEPAAGTTTAEEVKVTLVKDGDTWKVYPATTPADLVTVKNDGTVTIPERSVADASVVKAYSQGKDDSKDQKSATVQVTVLPDDVTKLNIDSIHLSSHNDASPAKLDDITEFTLTGYAGSTDPSAKVQVKFGDKVIGESVADKDGGFTLIFREPEGVTINAHDKLTIVATAPTKKPSTAQEKEVPEIVKDSTGYKNDEIAPESPSVTVGKDGDNQVKITPKDPQPGDKIQISVVDNEGNTQEIIVNVDKDGNLVPDTNNPTAPAVTIKDGVIELDRTQIKDNTNIVVTEKDIAGNTSEPAIKNSGFDGVTDNPTIDKIVANDTDLQADKNPETFTISGTAPAGSKVIAKDEQGNVIGETIADGEGKYQIDAKEKGGNDIDVGSKIYVTAQEIDKDGKPTKGESEIPAVGDVDIAATHSNDNMLIPPAKILDPKNNGDVDVILPEETKSGDKSTISVGKDTNGNGTLDPDEITDSVTLEKGEDGKWKPIDGNKDLVKPTDDNNVVTLPNDKVPNDSIIKVEMEDLAGNKTETEEQVENKLPQTPVPTDIHVTAKDEDNPANGEPDSMTVSGKAEPNSVITITLNGKKYSGQADDKGNFSIKVAAEDLKVGDDFEVKAQAPNKTPSEPASTDSQGEPLKVPAVTEFADNVEPGKATIGNKNDIGDVPVTLDENAQPGDQYTINVGKDTDGNGKLDPNEITGSVTLEKQEDGSWKPVSGNEDLVKKPIENNTALIPSDKVKDGDNVNVVGKDKAGNTSETEKTLGDNTPTVEPTEQTKTPVIHDIKAIDTNSTADGNPEKVLVTGTTDEPNAEIVIKDGEGNIIGKGQSSGTADAQGKYPFEIEATELTGKDLTVDEKLTITATAEGKSESDVAKMSDDSETKVPPVENNAEGHPNDTSAPSAPEVTQKDGTDDARVTLPKDAVAGDQVIISKDLNGDGVIEDNEKTVIEKGTDGTWAIKGNDPLNIGNDNIDNTKGDVTVPAENGDKVLAESQDIAGNTSDTDSETISPAQEKSTPPTDIEITAIDTSNPADNSIEQIKVKGKVENAADGTKVIVYGPNGKTLGEGTVQGGQGEFEFSVPNTTKLKQGDALEIKALEKDKEESDAGTGKNGDNTVLGEIPRTAEGHPNDPTGPSAPELVNVPKSGAVAVILPKDANLGDKVEVKFTDEKDQEQTVTLTKQADGSWTSDKEDVIPSVKDNLSQPQVVIPENTLKDGKEVSAKSIDGFVDGAEKAAEPVTAGEDAKTNTPAPEEVKITPIDKNTQADGYIDAIRVEGTVEKDSLVVVYQGDKEIGRVQLKDGETQFNIEIGENAGEINAGDPIRIVAKAPGKDASEPYNTVVPNDITFLDKQAPQDAPIVRHNDAKGKGDVTVSVPENPKEPFVSGDKLIVTYTDENDKEHTATLTYNGVGGWRSDDPNVPSIPKGQFSTTIAEDHLKDKSVVSAIFQDVASNESAAGVAIAGYDEITPTPTVDSIVGTDTDNDGNPETVVIKGKLLDESGKPLVNVPITVTLEDGTVLGENNPLILTNDKGEYEVTLTEGQNNVPSPLKKGTRFKVSAEQEGLKDSSDDKEVQAPAVTILKEDITVKGIDLDAHSNSSPEQFSISGTSEKGATVSAYITVNDKEVKIGEVNVDAEDGKFTLKTTALSDLNLGDFKYSVKANDGDTKTPTAITLKAEKADQSPSPVRTTEAKRVDQGTGSDSDAALKAEIFPNDKESIAEEITAKVTALPNGFGGARIELPNATDETFLEVEVSYPPKGGTGDNDTLTLTWDGKTWTSNKPDVIANPTEFIAYLSPEKVSEGTDNAKNNVTVITRDYAGNKSAEKTATLEKPAGDDIPDRTDLPTLVAGSDKNAGDLVATPGADNDKLEVKFKDDQGQDQTITIVKDPIAGEWKIEGENPTGATLDNTTGKVTVPANKVKDGSEAEAIGHKGEKPSTAEFKDANNLPTSVHVKVTANADDATPNEADAPTVTGYKDVQENEANYQLKGGATVKVGGDNVEVMINAKGYVEVMTGADGSRHTSGLTVAPFKTTETPTDQGSTKVEEQEIIIRAQKDPATGEWTLQGATKGEFDKAQTLTLTDDEKNGLSEEEQAVKLAEKKASIWNEIPSDIAIVDKDGNITLKPNALVDNSAVSAKGYNAKHKESSEAKVDDIGAEPRDKDVDADEPEIPQTNRDGSMSITPGADNDKVKVTYTKGNQEKTLEIEKGNTGTDNQVEWKVKDGTALPDNVTLDKSTGKLHFPKGTVDVNTKMTAVGTNKHGYDSDPVSQPVLKDPTPFADAPQAVVDGDKVVVTPGADSEKVKITGTTNDPVTIVKGDNGEWKWENGTEPNGFKLDPKTGKVTINNDKIGQDGIIAEATDGYEPTPNTKQSNNGKPVKPIVVDDTANFTEAPELTPIESGEKQGAMTVKPKDDHVEVKVTYTDEQGNTGSITAVRDPQTGKWSLAPTVKVEEKDGKTLTTEEPVPASKAVINKDTGEITLMADELQDGETVKAVAKDVKGNYSTEATAQAAPDPDNKPLPEDEQPKDNPIVIPTPTPETPTLFENRGAGEVRITAGKGVDYISFNVELDVREEGTNQTQHGAFVNYVLVKNDEDQWEQYVYRIVDKNNNGSIDENEGDDFVDITNAASTLKIDMSQSTDGVFTLKNGTVGTPDGHNPNATYISRLAATAGDKVTPNGKQGKIFGIMIGREGEEFIDLPNDNTSDKRLVVLSDKGSIDDFDIVTTNSDGTGASNAPLYHHVLSNGSDLTSPVITVGKNADNKTTLKIKFDPDTYAMSFASVVYDSTYPEGGYKDYPGFNLYRDAGIWKNSNWTSNQITQVDPNDNNVVIIQPTDNLHFYYDHEANEAYRWLTSVKYGAKDTEGLTLGDFFPIDASGNGNKAIGLPNIDLSKATDGLTPGQPRPPKPVEPTDNAEKVDKPTAEVDSAHQGGVKVKPAEQNSGSKYRVDYLDETTGEPKVINVKKDPDGKWKFDQDGSTGSIDNAKIKLDENTGELTFAPEAVADGGIVTITVFDSQGNPRVNNSVVALDEPLPNVTIEQDSTQTNIGGVVTKVVSGTNKFEVRFTDEGRNNTSTLPKDHVLVYEKKGSNWELVSVDGDSNNKKIVINGEEKDLSQANNETIKLDANSGQVTFDKDAIGDKSTVTITPYSKRGTLAGGAAKSVQSAVDKLMTYLDESNVTEVKDVGKLDYVYIDAKHGYYRGLKQLLAGYENNSKPTPKLNNDHSENGRRLDFDDNANIVRIDTSINYTTYPRYQSGYNFDLDFDFKGGNDLLLVGNDVGTGGVDGNGRRVSNIQMGDGNDLFVVGAHNDWFYVVRHKENGTFDVVHWDQYQDIRDKKDPNWEDVGFYAGGRKGGQIRHTEIGMGDGDDTLLVLGVNGGNVADRATYDAIIDLGEGNNRLIVSQEIDAHKSIANSVITAGSGVDVVKAGGIIEGSSISLGGGDDEVIVGRFDDSTIDLGDGNDWMEVTPMRGASAEIGGNAKVYLGNGNDVFKLGAKLNASDNSIIDGGNGSDFLLFDVSGAIISSTNVRNFEEVGFMQSDSTFNIRGYEVSGIIKVTQADNQNDNKVDLGTAGTGHHESGENRGDQFADKDGTYWTKNSGTVVENGITYNVYTYNNSNTQVWVENGIEVI
ncbi:Ig-like domain-containing protein [Actinobacillus porcinus]|uniref:Ig-like domain-containing protein n=1 Tax=Actinobacillus porcinus TaxID=51048 RepID=UPI002A9112AD|nr:Ig-like domain-containing protein [Actinobacillus porcinus]MDY6215632.1 Ig-like domain-containing protein [Actinobacillus porcinus]